MAGRTKYPYSGTVNLSGFILKARNMELFGEIFTVPEHIVPIVQKKAGKVSYFCWQVRLTPSYKSFKNLGDAIQFLSKEIIKNPPKRESKFVLKEMRDKKYRTGLVGVILQHYNHSPTKIELRLVLTFKRHTLADYQGTLATCDRERYEASFIRLFTIRRWLEELSRERDFGWMTDNKKLLLGIFEEIPDSFKEMQKPLAEAAIEYQGFDDYIRDLINETSIHRYGH